ncbi:MAG: CsbD family protein [Steroidobacteraceae bacterium]
MGMNKDQVEGRVKEGAGKVQEVAGRAVGNRTQEGKGMVNKTVGAGQAKLGDVKEKLRETTRDAERDSRKDR